jgi:hypothetical protein
MALVVRVKEDEGEGHVACMGEEIKCTRFGWGKPEGKRPLERLRRRWQDGIRMDFGGDWLGGVMAPRS